MKHYFAGAPHEVIGEACFDHFVVAAAIIRRPEEV